MKKMKYVALMMAVMISVLALAGCGGNDVEGTWYEVSSPSESNYLNMDFKGDGVVTQGGIEGKYEETDNGVNVDFMGSTGTLTWEEIAGCTVLHAESQGWYFAKSLADAEKVSEALQE